MSGGRQSQRLPCPPKCLHEDSQGYCAYRDHVGHGRGCPPGPDCACYEPLDGRQKPRDIPRPARRETAGYTHRPTAARSLEKDPKVLEMYQAGATDQEIADATGWSRRTVSKWRQSGGLPGNRKHNPIKDREAEVARLYDQGCSDNKIARTIGCSAKAVWDWRQRTGRKANHKPGWSEGKSKERSDTMTEDEKERTT